MFKLSILFVIGFVPQVHSHGRLMKPVNRSSIWRIPEFKSFNPPINYDDNALFCGGIHQKEVVRGNCGVCGDRFTDPTPRANDMGEKYYRGIIGGKYTAGAAGETQDCFNQNVLQRADGKGSKVIVDKGTGWYKAHFRLPAGVTCNHCTLQWNYRAGNDWGPCPDGTQKVGCGPQETFRGCSDIIITHNLYYNLLYLSIY